MGKFRHRVKSKGKRWRKGECSTSNPSTSRYREVAKCRFFQENFGEGNLTLEALKKHDQTIGEKKMNYKEVDGEENSDSQTFDGTFKTFKTFATDWSECSNASFSRLLNGFRSDSAIHKEMLAVLAAVTEVIKTNGGKESSVEYLAAMMTTLDACDSEESFFAVLQLIGMVIKNVPSAVLKFKFAEMSKTFVGLLGKFLETENPGIMRSLIGCISVLLRAQEPIIWSSSSSLQIFDSILTFTAHSKPKVRKAAQHAVIAILKASNFMLGENALQHHPAALHVAKHLIRQMENGSSLGGSTTTLHTLVLLKEVLSTFPKIQLKAACESILKVMTLGNILVTSCGMQALHSLFLSRPSTSSLTPQLNAQLITALFDYQPAPTDTQPTLAWLAVMQEAYINLGKIELSLCFSNLTHLFNNVIQLLLSGKTEIMNGATLTLKAVIEDCVSPACSAELFNSYKHILSKLFGIIESGLTYQYHSAWHHVLHILAVWFRVAGIQCKDFITNCLKLLADLRDSYKFSNVNELEFAVGQAVRSLGPDVVLTAIPLQITGEEKKYEFKRSWLLPVLKQNIRSNRLEFFVKYFLPLAMMCRKKRDVFSEQNDKIGAHSYDLLLTQIWSLLPCFCDNPSDLKENFKQIAKLLGTAIAEFKELRLDTMSAIRRIITTSKDAENQDNINEMARFAKNYLPILFNLYTTKPVGSDEEGQRLAAYETIKVYLQITDTNLCHELFDRALDKLNSDEAESFVKESVCDLLRALLSHQDSSQISKVFAYCEGRLANVKNHHEQKKTYRILEELCGSNSEGCKDFVADNMSTLQQLLISSLSTSANPSKGPRLRCLLHLVRKLDKSQLNMLKLIVPEAILCCKDINERCRTAAYNLLVEIGKVMQKYSDKSQDNTIRDYMGYIMAGLAGSPSLASATILALTRATHEFKDIMPSDLTQLILENVCLLLTTASREITSCALSFIKMYQTSFSNDTVAHEVPLIMRSIVGMTEDCKRHSRTATSNLLSRLIRKFGYENISRLVPASDTIMHKRIKNLHKTQSRRNKKQSIKESDDNSNEMDKFTTKSKSKSIEEILAESEESDKEDEATPSDKYKKKKKNKNTWIEEDADDIVDFTEISTVQKITSTDPKAQTKVSVQKKKSSDFKVAPDGRLIIKEDSDDESDAAFRKIQNINLDSDSDGDDAKSMKSQVGRKRKLSVSTKGSQPAMKYKAGGSGIHRPIKRTASSALGSFGEEYRAKKAKGDIKKKGKPDPHAYVPLSRNMLNRRKKKKQAGQFANLCRAANKGAKKGIMFRKKKAGRRN